MKRTKSTSSSPQRGSETKKPRLDTSNRFEILSSSDKDTGGEWTKVEKRKQKKMRHVEAKLSVSVFCLSFI